MAFFNEFPFTRCYDSDLAWLIRRMKELLVKMDRVDELMAELQRILDALPEQIRAEVIRQLQALIDDGTFSDVIAAALDVYAEPLWQGTIPGNQLFSVVAGSGSNDGYTLRDMPIDVKLYRTGLFIGGGGRERSSFVGGGSIGYSLSTAAAKVNDLEINMDVLQSATGSTIVMPVGAFDVLTCCVSMVDGGTSYMLHAKPYYYKTPASKPTVKYFDFRVFIPPTINPANFSKWYVPQTSNGTMDFYLYIPVAAHKNVA